MSYSKRPGSASYTKRPKRRLYPGAINRFGNGQGVPMPATINEETLRKQQAPSPSPQPRQDQDLTLGHISQSIEVKLKSQTVDPAATLALRDPRLRAQQLCSMAEKVKVPLELEVKESTLQDQQPRRFQLIKQDLEKNLFQAENQTLVTARLPTHKEILTRAQQLWKSQHSNSMTLPQEGELINQGYAAKAKGELIALENVKAKQANDYMTALKNEMRPFGYTILAAT